MRKLAFELPARLTTLLAAGVWGLLPVCFAAPLSTNEILAAYPEGGHYSELTILNPGNETLFPPEIAPCTFSWREGGGKADAWLVVLEFPDDRGRLAFLSQRTEWTPAAGGMGGHQAAVPGEDGQGDRAGLPARRAGADPVARPGPYQHLGG